MRCGAHDVAPLVAAMLPAVLAKLDAVVDARSGAARDLQGLLCGTLQARALPSSPAPQPPP